METNQQKNSIMEVAAPEKQEEKVANQGTPAGFVDDGIFVKQDSMMVKIKFDDIIWIEADGNYSHFHLKGRHYISVVHNLGRVEQYLPKHLLTRINKSEIVNLRMVTQFCGNLIYINGRSFAVAAPYRKYVFSCFCTLIRNF